MAIETYELAFYSVSLIAGPSEHDRQAGRPAATIHMTPIPEHADVGIYLRYYRSGSTAPKNRRMENPDGSKMYMISYLLDQLPFAVDLLRNEKPMFFRYDSRGNQGFLSTEEEPVGENE